MSISSTLKTISMADRMSVSQLQQAVKDGTIPAYIAVPLIQERVKDKQEAQMAAAGAQQQQPPVAQQVMDQASQQEAIASLPTEMPQQYAGGGIVAFADGGDAEDDLEAYNDALEEQDFQSFVSGLAGRTPLNKTPATGLGYGDVQGQRLRADRKPESSAGFDARGHKYDDMAAGYAEKIGLNPALARYVLKKETGGLKEPEKAVSRAGAIGPMQLMPATAKGLGVDPRDPEQNVMGGVKYLKQMMDKYGDERLALAAYNAGPGRVDAAIKSGRGIEGLPAETMRYIGMAGGGIVAFAGGGNTVDIGGKQYELTEDPDYVIADGVRTKRSLVEQSAQSPWNTGAGMAYPDLVSSEDISMGIKKPLAAAGDVLRYPVNKAFKGINALTGWNLPATESDTPFYDQYVRPYEQTSAQPTAVAPETKKVADKTAAAMPTAASSDEGKRLGKQAGSQHFGGTPAAKTEAPAEEVKTAEAPVSPWDRLLANIEKSRARATEQADQDKYMGLLGAGLAAMAGTSQNPLANIGQGAMYGMGQYAQARKGTAAEQAALDKAEATALRYKSMDEYYKDKLEGTEAAKKAERDQKEYVAASNVMKSMYENRVDQAKAIYGKPELWDDKTRANAMAFINQVKTDPRYIDAERRMGTLQGFSVVGQRPAA